MQIINVEQLRDVLHFDLQAGRVYWKSPSKFHPDLIGAEAGCEQSTLRGKSYWVIKIHGKKLKRSRMIFLIAHGRYPHPCVDHINGNSLDDRLLNLREATITENAWNHRFRARRIELPMGVRALASGRYQARISLNKKQIHLGSFETPDQARSVYLAKRKELYREFA
jgi:hypothetical protein